VIGIAVGEVVIRRVCSNGCTRRPDLDLPASYAFSYRDGGRERVFFIPHELTGDGYTQAQLEEIERTLACHGFDLLPLDHHVH
jgi:hypothetical protein